jgi:hypothetical protein
MAGEIAGRPHWEVGFDERGTADQGEVAALLAELPGKDLTDLLVFSMAGTATAARPAGSTSCTSSRFRACSPRGAARPGSAP